MWISKLCTVIQNGEGGGVEPKFHMGSPIKGHIILKVLVKDDNWCKLERFISIQEKMAP